MTTSIRILITDDHAIVREGQRALIETEPDMEVVGEAADGIEAVELARTLQPDVILLDMRMPKMSGIEVLKRLRRAGLAMPIVMLTTSREESDVVNALQNGARGYLLKDMEPEELIKALQDTAEGDSVAARRARMALDMNRDGLAGEVLR